MTRVFDRILLAVPDLAAAAQEYQLLFTVPGTVQQIDEDIHVARWALANTVIELRQQAVQEACVHGLAFVRPDGGERDTPLDNRLGLDLLQCGGQSTSSFRDAHPESLCEALRVDHVVLRTDNADACIDLFGGELGIRLALDQTVEAWGGRMLFFRGGKLTLEVIESAADGSRGNFFWGLAYQCADLPALRARLTAAGATVSEIRDGRKPGTRVATLKSHCLDIPTLLIQAVEQ